jgi:hypothetical protein
VHQSFSLQRPDGETGLKETSPTSLAFPIDSFYEYLIQNNLVLAWRLLKGSAKCRTNHLIPYNPFMFPQSEEKVLTGVSAHENLSAVSGIGFRLIPILA